jgi:hypothetical protein
MEFRNSQMFWRNIRPPSSGSKNNPHSACHLLLDAFLSGLFFDPEDGSNMFPPEHQAFSKLSDVATEKTVLF